MFGLVAGTRRAVSRSLFTNLRSFSTFRFAESHEWVSYDKESNRAKIGISDYAQKELGDLVYVELPVAEDVFDKTDAFGCVESVKSSSSIYMPIGGTITAVNDSVAEKPEMVNGDAMGEGWMVEIEPSDISELEGLMDADAYEKFIQ